MISSPTLHRAKPLTRNVRTLADGENAGEWSERDSDATSPTDGDVETKKKQKRLERSAWRRARQLQKAGEDPTLANLSSESRNRGKVQKASRTVPQFCGRGNTGARRGRLPTLVREVGRTEACSVVESSGRLEKTGSDTLKATVAENDLVWSLLGDGEKQETSDGHPYPDDDCDALPAWRTVAVDAERPDQTNAWCDKRLVTAPPRQFNEACRAKHKATTTRST